MAKLHFIDHPRYGKVYPVVCMNEKQHRFGLAKAACFVSSMVNSLIFTQLFIKPVFVPAVAALVSHPLVFLPSFMLNYALF